MMNVSVYTHAAGFLDRTQDLLEKEETACSLMYGLAIRLKNNPLAYKPPYLLATVDQDGATAAAALMTPPHDLAVYLAPQKSGGEEAEAMDVLARYLVQEKWPVPGVLGPARAALAMVQAYADAAGCAYRLFRHERVYELRQVTLPAAAPGRLRKMEAGDVEILLPWLMDFNLMAEGRADESEGREALRRHLEKQSLYVWEDNGRPVSMVSQTRATPHGTAVGMVYTPPENRRRGYAGRMVAEFSQRLLDSGFLFCNLFTDLANPTSNHIYQEVGYTPICDYDHYKFGPP